MSSTHCARCQKPFGPDMAFRVSQGFVHRSCLRGTEEAQMIQRAGELMAALVNRPKKRRRKK